jgi:tRNA pseudouridine55 synthase
VSIFAFLAAINLLDMNTHGLLVIDKPGGMTSRTVVNRALKWFPRKTKIGHAGTLDPLATGVLVLAAGHATRLLEYVQAQPKVYRTRLQLGGRSTTDDADGTVTLDPAAKPVSESDVRTELTKFLGTIEQIPPAFSAAHIDGQRAYDLARRGAEVELTARPVRIDRIEVREYVWPELELDVYCGKGTYIRSIARDLGDALQVGGYVKVLRRLAIGSFTVENAITLDTTMMEVRQRLQPMANALTQLAPLRVNADEARRLRLGQFIPVLAAETETAALDEAGELVAVGIVENGLFKPDKVIPV